MISAHQLSRACRVPGYVGHVADVAEPPAYLVLPTVCAQTAVRRFHQSGPEAARSYLRGSAVGRWALHDNPSMASNSRAVLQGLYWYIQTAETDGRSAYQLGRSTSLRLGNGEIAARLDVVLRDGDGLAGRVVLWDAPRFEPQSARVSAYCFAAGLSRLYPGRTFTTVAIWQARRQQSFEVPFDQAMEQAAAANAVLARLIGS